MALVKKTKPAAPEIRPRSAAARPRAGQKQSLFSWIFGAPLKFAFVSAGLFVALLAVISLIAPTPLPGAEIVIPEYLRIITIVFLIAIPAYSIYMLATKWTPSGNLDRRSFAGLYTVLTIVSVLTLGAAFLTGWYFQSWVFALIWFMNLTTSQTLILLVLVLFMLVVLFEIGIYLSAKYAAMYWRLRAMGVARWKFWCTFPFGWSILLYPALFLPEDKKAGGVLPIKPTVLSRITDWAYVGTLNAALLFIVLPLALLALVMPYAAGMSISLALIPVAIFFILWAIFGNKKMNAAMPGWFANMTIILNILAIIAYVCFLSFAQPNVPAGTVAVEDIQVTETME